MAPVWPRFWGGPRDAVGAASGKAASRSGAGRNVGEEGEGNLSGMRYLCRPSGFAARVKAFLVLDGRPPTTSPVKRWPAAVLK